MTPAGTSNELGVQNEWEENTTHYTTFMKKAGVFEGLVTYSKVKRINRGYVTHYNLKLTFGIRTIQ